MAQQEVVEEQEVFFKVLKKAFEKGKEENTTLFELLEELKDDLKELYIKECP